VLWSVGLGCFTPCFLFGLLGGVQCVVGWCCGLLWVEGVRKRYPNDKNYSVANPFGLQYASQAPVMLWFAPRTGIELVDPLHPTNR
jgi:hypothetical protein